MLKFIITIALFTLFFKAGSQTFEVKCFRWLEDTIPSANLITKTDPSLKNCPVIKVITSQKGLDFNFDSKGNALALDQKDGEIWLWAPVRAQKIYIIDKQTKESCVYPFGNELEEKGVYELFLKTNSGKKIPGNQIESIWLTMNTNPQGANIFIDDVAVGQTLFVGSIPLGDHKLLFEINGVKEEGTFHFSKDDKPNVWLDFIKEGMIPDLKDTKTKIVYRGNNKDPEFPGGFNNMTRFFLKNIHYPISDNAEGNVFVSFIVSKTGKIYNVRVLRGISSKCDQEAIRVTKMMPNWIPGKVNGQTFSCQFQIPIKFQP